MNEGLILHTERRKIGKVQKTFRREKMIDWNLAFLIAGAGYGITISVLLIISVIIWIITLVTKKEKIPK